jgi:diacylglycerol kinase
MNDFLRTRMRSFRHAFHGWIYVLRTQRNAWVHATASLAVVLLGWLLELKRLEWALLFFAIALVWIAEFLNTALEAIVDLASPEYHPLAKVGKDVGAAAVLIAALAAALIGVLIFAPALLAWVAK